MTSSRKKIRLFKIPREKISYLDFKAVQDRNGNFHFNFSALLVGQIFQFLVGVILINVVEKIFSVAKKINFNALTPRIYQPIFFDAVAFINLFFYSHIAFHCRAGKNFGNHVGTPCIVMCLLSMTIWSFDALMNEKSGFKRLPSGK